MKIFHLALSSSGLSGCLGQRVNDLQLVAMNSYPRQASEKAWAQQNLRQEGGLERISFDGGQR